MGIIQIKILITQLVIWISSIGFLSPDSYLGEKLEDWFGDYSFGLNTVMSVQLFFILLNVVILIWLF